MYSPFSDRRFNKNSSGSGSDHGNFGSPPSSSNFSNSLSYLPPYLMRDRVSPTTPTTNQQNKSWISPMSTGMGSPHNSPSPQKTLLPSPPSSAIDNTTTSKRTGPPTESLSDLLDSPLSLQRIGICKDNIVGPCIPDEYARATHDSLFPKKLVLSPDYSTLSPNQIDPFYTQGEALQSADQLDETWVTVFGFPAASITFILQQFSIYGRIVNYKQASCGNWIHIKYQTKFQAKKAISKSGKIYGSNMMIGVKPCIDLKVFADPAQEDVSQFNKNFDISSAFKKEQSKNSEPYVNQNFRRIRSLTNLNSTILDRQITVKQQEPPALMNFLTKTMEFVLNWRHK